MNLQSSLAAIQVDFQEIYQNHWYTMNGSKSGKLKDIFHFPLLTETDSEIESNIKRVLSRYRRSIKVNVSFGFILKERLDGQLKFFHPSNNSKIFETPKRISSNADINALLEDVEYRDAIEYAKTQRPSTKWIPMRIVCLRLDIFKTL